MLDIIFEQLKDKKVIVICENGKQINDFEKRLKTYINTVHKYTQKWSFFHSCNKSGFKNFNRPESEYDIIVYWSDYMRDKFEKLDLNCGDVIVRKNGDVGIVCLEKGVIIGQKTCKSLDRVNEDLTDDGREELDIIDVYRPMQSNQCNFNKDIYTCGRHVYHREEKVVNITL